MTNYRELRGELFQLFLDQVFVDAYINMLEIANDKLIGLVNKNDDVYFAQEITIHKLGEENDELRAELTRMFDFLNHIGGDAELEEYHKELK